MILQTSLVFGQFESTANACCISFNPFGRQTLMSQGFIEQDRSTRLYFLGVEFLALGAKSANRRDIQSLARGSLATLAKLSGDTVYLALRSGTKLICVDAQEGNYPIKVLTLTVEIRAGRASVGLRETYFLFGCALEEGAASARLQKEIQMGLQAVEISRDSSTETTGLFTWNTRNSSRLASRSSWTRRSSRRRLRQNG
jgi:hypothetical protein